MSIEAMKQALEALESATPKYTCRRKDQKTLGGALDYWKLEQHQRLKAITALRTAIEEAESRATEQAEKQEPVAQAEQLSKELLGVIADVEEGDGFDDVCLDTIKYVYEQLATPPAAPVQERNFCERCGKRLGDGHIHTCTPPAAQRQWIGLTEEEHTQIAVDAGCMSSDWVFYGAAVERTLKEKNK
jgi:hypothetical protein